jgi:hypothetical protein
MTEAHFIQGLENLNRGGHASVAARRTPKTFTTKTETTKIMNLVISKEFASCVMSGITRGHERSVLYAGRCPFGVTAIARNIINAFVFMATRLRQENSPLLFIQEFASAT